MVLLAVFSAPFIMRISYLLPQFLLIFFESSSTFSHSLFVMKKEECFFVVVLVWVFFFFAYWLSTGEKRIINITFISTNEIEKKKFLVFFLCKFDFLHCCLIAQSEVRGIS